jgi:Predicted nucleotide-binding protein containing TIR-like domain
VTRPSVFIGSSSEGLEVARAIEYQLQNDVEVTIWNDGSIFGLGQAYLESLVNALERFDFAILVLTPDDFVTSREVSAYSPRDNLLFELGLFMGKLGRSRTFAVYDTHAKLKLPSDLAGISHVVYNSDRSDKSIISALGPACTAIRNTIRDLGMLPSRDMENLQKATSQVENVSQTMEQLIHLLARSRVVELDIIDTQFGGFIPKGHLEQIRRDLKDLEKSLDDE